MFQLDHINMTVNNLRESIQWYKNLFSFELMEKGISANNNSFAILRNGNSMLCLYEFPHFKSPSENMTYHKSFHFGLRINNRNEWEKIIEQKKVEVTHTASYPHSFSWYILDPSGHEIEIVSWNKDQIKFNPLID